jgi:hypothetical protein
MDAAPHNLAVRLYNGKVKVDNVISLTGRSIYY